MESNGKDKVKEFIEKCKSNMEVVQQNLVKAINEKNQYVTLYAYKIVMFEEILNMFEQNKGGLGYWLKAYNGLKSPLDKIFNDIITEFDEPHLLTENKMYKVLDKKGLSL